MKQQKIITVNKEQVKEWEQNPRKINDNEFSKLKRSIKEFGFVEPIIIDENNIIIGGHQRIKALYDLNINIPITAIQLTGYSENEKAALNVALNKISGDWHVEKLQMLIDELKLDHFDISLTGFDVDELADLGIELDILEEETSEKDDIIPEVEEENVVIKLGDLIELGNHRLLCGDCNKKENREILFNNIEINQMLTDPPYNIGLDYNEYNDKLKTEDYIELMTKSIYDLNIGKKIITPGPSNIFLIPKYFNIDYLGLWYKGKASMSGGKITLFRTYEPIFFIGKYKRKRHNDFFEYCGVEERIKHACPNP